MLSLSSFSKGVLALTAALCAALFLFAVLARSIAPLAPDYLWAMTVAIAARDTVGATAAAGVIGAVLSDIALHER